MGIHASLACSPTVLTAVQPQYVLVVRRGTFSQEVAVWPAHSPIAPLVSDLPPTAQLVSLDTPLVVESASSVIFPTAPTVIVSTTV